MIRTLGTVQFHAETEQRIRPTLIVIIRQVRGNLTRATRICMNIYKRQNNIWICKAHCDGNDWIHGWLSRRRCSKMCGADSEN